MKIVPLLAIFWTFSSAIGEIWTPYKLPIHQLDAAAEHAIDIRISNPAPCGHDEFSISWQTRRNMSVRELLDVQLAIVLPDESVHITPVSTGISISAHGPRDPELIHCADPDPLCVANVKNVVLDPTSPAVTVLFSVPVTQPDLLTRSAVATALSVTPSLSEEAAVEWVGVDKLILRLGATDAVRIVSDYQSQHPVSFSLKHPSSFFEGNLSLRSLTNGVYRLFAVDLLTQNRLSEQVLLTVRHCASAFLPDPYPQYLAKARLVYEMKGTLAMTGKNSIVLTDEAIPCLVSAPCFAMFFGFRFSCPSSTDPLPMHADHVLLVDQLLDQSHGRPHRRLSPAAVQRRGCG